MNKNKKKGFTLVELLAVIVILAVVIIIAVTAVVPRMNNAKKKSFLDEALVYVKAAKEAYVTDPSTECYNVSDMSNLVKQNKSGYSGTIFVNEKGVSLNLTNGKYYIKTNKTPNEVDIVETTPDKYVSTCSDNTNYSITYDLNGGSPSGTNPSSYTPATGTDMFYNPTKSGYRFVGWSSKNILDVDNRSRSTSMDSQQANTNVRNFEMNKYYVGFTANNYVNPSHIKYYYNDGVWTIFSYLSGYGVSFPIKVEAGTDYTAKFKCTNNCVLAIGCYDSSGNFITNYILSSSGARFTTPSNCTQINVVLRPTVLKEDVSFTELQVEKNSSSTHYQEFMEPTMNVKVYKGETGNKKFIANWEAI